ncbi:MAG: hypothetical protein CMO44_12590 [Verrucomicrobiales bacterium]|nr:hypothetical protein [Verrucomicrobiales bacterium]
MLFDELDEFDVHEGLGSFGQVAKHQAGCAEEDGVCVLADEFCGVYTGVHDLVDCAVVGELSVEAVAD